MKIINTKPTYYFNESINLSPTKRETTVILENLSNSVIRQLFLGYRTGVIDIVEELDKFLDRVQEITESSKKEEKVVEVKEEKIEEEAPTKVEQPVEEKVESDEKVVAQPVKKPTTKRTTTTKKE